MNVGSQMGMSIQRGSAASVYLMKEAGRKRVGDSPDKMFTQVVCVLATYTASDSHQSDNLCERYDDQTSISKLS